MRSLKKSKYRIFITHLYWFMWFCYIFKTDTTTDKFLNIIVERSWIDLINKNGRRLNKFIEINT